MCGILGVYGVETYPLEGGLQKLAHRGPDGVGQIRRANGALGHTRLAIVDVEGGAQPIADTAERRWLVVNGEIYNHHRLRARCADYPFRTQSDSESILALYQKYGPAAVTQLDGMFAFALMDETDLVLARDPLGIKPLYYGTQGGALYFASEVKALQDLVEHIEEFPPGHVYTTADGFTPYYDVPTVAARAGSLDETPPSPADVQTVLREAVHKRLMSDVPLGVFLSGGLDSSIISALVCENHRGVHSFVVGLEGSEDLAASRLMARHLGTQHHEYVYTPQEMIEALPQVIYHLESFDPALVRSAVPNYFLARLAGEYVTVVLSGEGADELYSGYGYLRQFAGDPARLQRELVEITAALHNTNLQRLDRMTMAHGLEGRVPFLDRASVAAAFAVPIAEKVRNIFSTEKWILRKAFEDLLPPEIAWRGKQKFAEGAGSATVFQRIAEDEIDDAQFAAETRRILAENGQRIDSKETLYFYRIFCRFFEPAAAGVVGRSRSL